MKVTDVPVVGSKVEVFCRYACLLQALETGRLPDGGEYLYVRSS